MTRGTSSRRTQAGFVLVNALILIAALSLVALQVLQGSERSRRALTAAQTTGQLELLGDAGVALAASLLERDFRANHFDHLDEAWQLDGHIHETDQGSIRVTVGDLQARLNVNLVAIDTTGASARALGEILAAAGLSSVAVEAILGRFSPPAAAGSGLAGQAGNDAYQKNDVVRLDEFASAPEFEPDALAKLVPLLAALPSGRGINVNTADREVLAGILGNRPEQVAAVIDARATRPFEDIATFREFVSGSAIDGITLPLQALSVQSYWFEVMTEAKIGSDVRRMRTTLVRDTATGMTQVFAKSHLEVP